MLPLVDIIKLGIIDISQNAAKGMGIKFAVVRPVLYHQTCHRKPYRLLLSPDGNCRLFTEMSQHTSIIGHRNSKDLTCPNTLFGIYHLCTSTVGFYTRNRQMAVRNVLQFKGSSNRYLKSCLTYINLWLRYLHFLRNGHQSDHAQETYHQNSLHLTSIVCDLATPRNSGL